MVIDFLHDDLLSLDNCSLVCKAWLSSSQLHLFHSISVPNYQRPFARLPPFLAAVPSSAYATRNLSMRHQGPLTIYELQAVLSSLPRLRVLELTRCTFPQYRADRIRPTPCIPHISVLTLSRCNHNEADMDSLLDLISLFSVIDYLKVQNENIKFMTKPRESCPGPGPSSTSLRTISAAVVPLSFISRLVLHSKAPAEIRRIELISCTTPHIGDGGAAQLRTLLDAMTPTLASFGIMPTLYYAFSQGDGEHLHSSRAMDRLSTYAAR